MSFRLLLTIFAGAHVVGGLVCVIAPVAMLASVGVALPAMGLVVYQFWGASISGVGALVWLLRDTTDRILNPLLAVLICPSALNAVIAVRGQFAGASQSGWIMVLLYSLFALAFPGVVIRSMRQWRHKL